MTEEMPKMIIWVDSPEKSQQVKINTRDVLCERSKFFIHELLLMLLVVAVVVHPGVT
jgi:hypothetical protein